MSIPRRHPIVEVGDSGSGVGSLGFTVGHYSAWRVDGIRDENSDRGSLYLKFVPSGLNVIMEVYSDRERTELESQSPATPVGATARVTAVPVGDSRLTVSAIVINNRESSTVTIWVQLATLDDIKEREDDAAAFFVGTSSIAPFEVIGKACMRQFYLNVQALYPPPQRAGAPLALHGTSQVQIAGRRGLPDLDGPDFWSLNPEGDWELVGLQNVADFKEWAISWSLGLIWKRRAGGDDEILKRSMLHFEDAQEQWQLLPYLVDFDRDGTPEREVRRSSRMISRG